MVRMGYRRGVHWFWLGKPEGNRPPGGPSCRREDNIKWIFKKKDGGINWTDLPLNTRERHLLVNAGMNFWVP